MLFPSTKIMKRHLTFTTAFLALLLAGRAPGQDLIKLEVLAATNVHSMDEHLQLHVRVTNQTKDAVLVPIPVKGSALGLEVTFAAPDGWEKQKSPQANSPGITVVTSTHSFDSLQIPPGGTQQFVLDLRDYFAVIDLRQREYGLEVKIVAMAGSSKDNPNGTQYPANWRGKLSLPIKDLKGTTIRM
jgi:hypothetical protein